MRSSNEGPAPTPSPRQLDARERANEDVGSALRRATNFLNELQTFHLRTTSKYGEQTTDYSGTVRSLEEAWREGRVQSVRGLYALLFDQGVSPGVIQALASERPRHEYRPSEADIKDRFFSRDLVQQSGLDRDTRRGGGEWLGKFLQTQHSNRQFNVETAHRVQALGREAAGFYGEQAVPLARLMFLAVHDTVRGRYVDPAETVEGLVRARLAEARMRHLSPENKQTFFEEMTRFLAVYSDITAAVLVQATPSAQERIESDARNRLGLLFQSREFQMTELDPDVPQVSPFSVFQRRLFEDPRMNPWIAADCIDTPFDASKFGLLMTPDAPRGLVAEAIVGLNNYPAERRALRARASVQVADTTGATWKSKQDLMLSDNLHPFAVLLRAIDPVKIIAHESLQQDFVQLFSELPSPRNDEQTAILARSVRDVLDEKTYVPELDLPLLHTQDQRSLSSALMEYALTTFDPRIIRDGPYARIDPNTPMRPLFRPPALRDYDSEREAQAKKNFNSAHGTDPIFNRRALMSAGLRWSERPGSYQEILNFARETEYQFRGIKHPRQYEVVFYRTATEAVRDFTVNVLGVKVGERVFVSNQEYQSISGAFQNQRARIGPNEIIYLNDPATRRSYTAEELFRQFKEKTDADAPPAALVLSTKTRFGDAPAAGRSNESNAHEVARLNTMLKHEWPSIFLLSDSCQSLGRNDTGEHELERSGFDALVDSGSKVGIPNTATLIFRKRYPRGAHSWIDRLPQDVWENPAEKLHPGQATDSIADIAAGALLKRELMGRVNPYSLQRIGSGTARDEIGRLLALQTAHAIDRANLYHVDLTTNPKLGQFPVSIRSDEYDSAQHRLLGCEVVYPTHGRVQNYDGILTLTFPSIPPALERVRSDGKTERINDFLTKQLQEKGFSVLQCLKGQHGIRMSFKPFHTTQDIDSLFEAIEEIHQSYLAETVQKTNAKTLEELLATVPIASRDWMEH